MTRTNTAIIIVYIKQTRKGTEMQNIERPEGVTEEQMAEVLAFLSSRPKVTVREEGATETRMLWSEEELAARRGKGGKIVKGRWNS